jgi:competence protein ComEC
MVALKPGRGTSATDLWSVRRGLKHANDEEALRDSLFECDREGCAPLPGVYPALGTWWSTRRPPADRLDALCSASALVEMRAEVELPPSCAGRTVLTPEDFRTGGPVELFADGEGLRLSWSEPLRGARPWTGAGIEAADRED